MKRKEYIKRILDIYPEGGNTKNKYKVITLAIVEMHPELKAIPNKQLLDIFYDVINADRDWRKLTEGENKEEKKILSQQWVIDNYIN